jgi:SH3 domain-containing YSC84-like protein 1
MYAEPLIALLAFVVSFSLLHVHRASPGQLGTAVAALHKFMDNSGSGIPAEQMRQADCVAVIPGFKKSSVGDNTASGRGFITCREAGRWSSPAAVIFESSNPGVRMGRQRIDLVMLLMDRRRRQSLLSGGFTIGRDASAVWGNGKTTRSDPNSEVLLFGRAKNAPAEFDLDGAMLKQDDSGNKALYGRAMPSSEIVGGSFVTSKSAQVLVNKLTGTLNLTSGASLHAN